MQECRSCYLFSLSPKKHHYIQVLTLIVKRGILWKRVALGNLGEGTRLFHMVVAFHLKPDPKKA
jgi:hypothetical protein